VSIDFASLLYRTLPGIYRDKDVSGELRRFLDVLALPLEEIDASIRQLLEDLFLSTANEKLVGLIGSLVGYRPASTTPIEVQRLQVTDAVAGYRTKGLRAQLAAEAELTTGWATTLVDMSERVALSPFIQDSNPLAAFRRVVPGESPPGSGNYFFLAELRDRPLYDAARGGALTRAALAGREAEYAGSDTGFTIEIRGVDVFSGPTPLEPIAANLENFGAPRRVDGTPLVVAVNQVAIDPLLGRFVLGGGPVLASNLAVSFHVLAPDELAGTLRIDDPGALAALVRSDEVAARTLDIRSPRDMKHAVGRYHFDNVVFHATVCRTLRDRSPGFVRRQSREHLTFDSALPSATFPDGVPLQLLDARDGAPITREALAAQTRELAGTERGFALRVRGRSALELEGAPVRFVAADLSDFADPKALGGAALALGARDIAVDPELGRISIDLAGLGAAVDEVRVDYRLGPATLVDRATAARLSSVLFAFSSDGQVRALRDRYDGFLLSWGVARGASLSVVNAFGRGFSVLVNGVDATPSFTYVLADLGVPGVTSAGRIDVDLARGSFRFPPGVVQPGDVVTVSYAFDDADRNERIASMLRERLSAALPASAVAVIADTRRSIVPPALLA
jgi:phage tail-like protein